MAQSLSAQSMGVQITGKNLANVNNPGYSRESVEMSTTDYAGAPAMGVNVSAVTQARDQLLDRQVTQSASQVGYQQALSDNLTTAQTELGEQINNSTSPTSLTDTGSGTSGISAALSNFFTAVSNLSSHPADPTAQDLVVEQATELTSQFNTTYSQLQSLQSDITSQAASDVATVNGLLGNIASLNGQIATEASSPGATLDLQDQRQSDLEQLAQYMNFTSQTIPNSNGQIQIASSDASGNSVVLVDRRTVVGGGVTFDGTQFSGGASSTTLALQGGSLAGEISARDGAIQQLCDNLQTTAAQLTSAVNTAYNPSGATGNFFQSAPSSGIIALDPALNTATIKATNTGNAGANELALAVSQVQNQNFSTSGGDLISGTITGFYSQTVSGIGTAVEGAQSNLSDQQAIHQLLGSQRDSVSGVSQDEELTNLMQYQRAYQASSQVVSVIDSLLNTVVNGMLQN